MVDALREANNKSNYFYRGCSLFILSLVIITYLTPVPAYIAGTHPENHLTLLWHPNHLEASHEDVYYLPAGPIYAMFLAFQGLIVYAAAREIADQMGLINATKARSFPAQPHLFGTAPDWLVPSLTDMRFVRGQTSKNMDQRADTPEAAAKTSALQLPPRLVYMGFLTVTSLPMPCMVFGAGNFINAGWWAISSAALVIVCIIEYTIAGSERELKGLDGSRYNYKGA